VTSCVAGVTGHGEWTILRLATFRNHCQRLDESCVRVTACVGEPAQSSFVERSVAGERFLLATWKVEESRHQHDLANVS
jgi:hypothetical protein